MSHCARDIGALQSGGCSLSNRARRRTGLPPSSRRKPVGLSAWDDLSAWRSSVSIGSSESIAQRCAGAAKHRMCESGHRSNHKSPTSQYLANSPICAVDSSIGEYCGKMGRLR
jgi:hypothetical protein